MTIKIQAVYPKFYKRGTKIDGNGPKNDMNTDGQ